VRNEHKHIWKEIAGERAAEQSSPSGKWFVPKPRRYARVACRIGLRSGRDLWRFVLGHYYLVFFLSRVSLFKKAMALTAQSLFGLSFSREAAAFTQGANGDPWALSVLFFEDSLWLQGW
jgi:hypothetical protein